MADALWTLDGVTLGGVRPPRLEKVSLEIREGVTAVLGSSGAGKTSLLNLLVGYERADEGTVSRWSSIRNPQSEIRNSHSLPVYWVPQGGGLWPHLTVREHLELVSSQELKTAQAMSVLDALGLAERAESRPDELSGGERSRLAVARALAADAAVLVMDEPFSSVDVARVGAYWEVVREHVAASGASLVFATHSPAAVLAEAERVVCLKEGRVLCEGSVADLYWRPRTAEEANCLGEGNWLAAAEARLWLGRDDLSEPRCFRPEQVSIEPSDGSPIVVRSSRFKGSFAEADLEHEATGRRRRFYHRPVSDGLRVGARVLLKVLVALFVCVLAGCGGSDEPKLEFTEIRYWMMPPDGAKIPAPRAVAIGHGGEVYVTDTAGRVLVLDEEGKLVRHWRMPDSKMGNPEGLCVLRDGRIAVADTHYSRVVLFDPDGKVSAMFGSEGMSPGQFRYPVAIAEDDKGDLYVAEYGGNDRVQKFTVEGKYVLQFGGCGTEDGQFQRPSGIVWDRRRVLVADAINNRIQLFTDKGEFKGVLKRRGHPLSVHFPYDIARGANGFFYVIEYGSGRLTRFIEFGIGYSEDWLITDRFGSTGRGEGQFLTPWGVAVDSKNRVYVADTGNRRIVRLTQ